jgi:hypothetical protein
MQLSFLFIWGIRVLNRIFFLFFFPRVPFSHPLKTPRRQNSFHQKSRRRCHSSGDMEEAFREQIKTGFAYSS